MAAAPPSQRGGRPASEPSANETASGAWCGRGECGPAAAGVTHVLLPAHVAPRRADSAHVILGALLAKAGGRGHRLIAAELSLPAGTVRGWLHRATANAEQAQVEAMRLTVHLDPLLGRLAPAGSPLTDALEALGAAVAAARLRLGLSVGSPTAMAMIIGKSLLHPLRA